MATRAAIVAIDAAARKRIDGSVAQLVERLGIEPPLSMPPARQPELQMAYEMERVAQILESVVAQLPAKEDVNV